MMGFLKRHVALLTAAFVIVAGAGFVATQQLAAAAADEVVLTQDNSAAPSGDAAAGQGPRGERPPFPGAIRGEVVVHAREGEGFDTVRFDRGVLDRVDGTTLVVTEDDGTTVQIPTTDETRIGRDGRRASVGDLQPGDHIAAFRVKDGDAFVTKGVRAISPERWDEFQGRRDGTRERFKDRRAAQQG